MPQNVSGVSSGHTRRREELKDVIVGDGGCGKTSLLMVYTKKYFPEGEETKRKIKAELYLECSAKYKENVQDIFREATKRALAATRNSRKAKRRNRFCALL